MVRSACTILFILNLNIFSVAQSGNFTQNWTQNPADESLNGKNNQFLFDEIKDNTSIAFEGEANADAFSNSMCAPVDLNILFDYFPEQTSWDITDANGNVMASSNGTYVNQGSYTLLNFTAACLPDGCYNLTFYDVLNNGMCPFISNAVGLRSFVTPGTLIAPGTIVGTFYWWGTPGLCGNYQLYDAQGTLMVSGGTLFGASETNSFCLVNGLAQ